MRRLPRKHEILKKARGISMERAVIQGLPAITPTEAELKESGVYREARIGLMWGASSEAFAEQERYVSDMASEMGLVLLRKREHKQQLRKVEAFDVFKAKYPLKVVKVNGYKILLPTFPKPKIQPRKPRKRRSVISKVPVKPKRKKRKRNHSARIGKTMRKLLRPMKNGKKVFAFPDSIWKVRQPRRKRRK